MIGSSLALLAAVVEALPPDAAATATEAAAAVTHGGINYLDLMLRASLPVKLIVLLLLAGSLISWVIIFRKLGSFKRADQADVGRRGADVGQQLQVALQLPDLAGIGHAHGALGALELGAAVMAALVAQAG